MNRFHPCLALILAVCTTALLLSCDAQKDATASEPGVWVLPRFAAGAVVPTSTRTVVGRLVAKGRPDTVRTVVYQSGGTIEFGTLPARTPFRLTLTGFDSTGTALWWSYADDTTGSSPVKDVLLTLAPVPLAAGSLLPSNSDWYKGDTLPVPAGAVYTVDGSDPRTSSNARQVLDSAGLAVDSNNTVKVAVRVPGDSALDRPDLWSPVETYTFTIDALDTITSLDTLFLSHFANWKALRDSSTSSAVGALNRGILTAKYDPDRLDRVDTLPSDLFTTTGASLHVYLRLATSRASASFEGTPIPTDSFFRIPLPADSLVRVVVGNHGRSRTYSVRLVKGWTDAPVKGLQDLHASVDGLRANTLNDKSWTLGVSHDQEAFSMVPIFPSDFRLRMGNMLWRAGDSIPVSASRDTTLTFWIVDSLADPTPAGPYTLQVIHAPRTIAFRDTTWGVPWRDVAYDTLVDARNGRKYRTVMVGNARWMAENLNFRRDSSFCPAVADSCTKNGRWYRWAAAADTTPAFDAAGLATTIPLKGVCPSGWHLPSETEWRALVALLGSSKSGILLRSVGTSWSQGGGEDSVGLRALPAGYRFVDAAYPNFFGTRGQTTDAYFWTSTQSSLDGSRAGSVRISGSAPAVDFLANAPKSDAYSVRCVEDAAP